MYAILITDSYIHKFKTCNDSMYNVNVQKGQLDLGEFDWWSEMNLFGDQMPHEALAAAEVPQLPMSIPSNHTFQYRPTKTSMPNKKARIEISHDDDDEYSIVPDLG